MHHRIPLRQPLLDCRISRGTAYTLEVGSTRMTNTQLRVTRGKRCHERGARLFAKRERDGSRSPYRSCEADERGTLEHMTVPPTERCRAFPRPHREQQATLPAVA